MSLADRMAGETSDEPQEFVPRTEFDGGSGFIQTGAMPDAPTDYDDLLREFGYDPAQVQIVGHPRVSRWQQRSRIRGTNEYETVWLSAYKFGISATGFAVDLPALYNEVRKNKYKAVSHAFDQATVVVCYADIQTGKVDHLGGVSDLLDRLEEKRAKLADYLKKGGYDHIVVADVGDIIEGFGNFPAQHRTNGLSLMKQVDVAATEFWKTIKLCSQYAPVDVLSIPSNHCVDADTEILTPQGWVRVEDFDGTGAVAIYDPESDSMQWGPVQRWTVKSHNGRMLHITSRTVDHMVTEDHDLFGRAKGTSRRKPMAKLSAQGAFTKSGWEFLQTAGSWEGKVDFPTPLGFDSLTTDPMLAARFYGWYVSEGSCYIRDAKSYNVVISQSESVHPENYAEIDQVWQGLGRSPSRSPKTLTVGSKPLALFMREHFGCTSGEKRLPSWLKDAPVEVLAEFMRAYLLGDGHNRPTWSTVASKSRRLMDDLQEVCLRLGWRMVYDQRIKSFPYRGTDYIGQAYVGYINKQRRGAVIEWAHHGRKENARWVDYQGTVYCPTVSTGLWFARRNGKVVVTGNCAWRREGKSLAGRPNDDWGLHINERLETLNEEAQLPVTFHRPKDDWTEFLLFPIRDTMLALAHGHQANNPKGLIPWWQRVGHSSELGLADVLLTGHFHFFKVEPSGRNPVTGKARWHIQAPTLDNGSAWVKNAMGEDGDPGLALFRITDDGFDLNGLRVL